MKSAAEMMAEALRLTKAGQVLDATKRLRGLVDGSAPSAGPTADRTSPPSKGLLGGLAALKIPDALKGLGDRLERVGMDIGLAGRPAGLADPLPEGARFSERVFASAEGQRSYKLYVPSGYRGQPFPLVVMLHGCTQSPDDFAAGTGMNRIGEEQGCLVAYPAQAQGANPQRCWNWFRPQDQMRDRGEPALIAGITRQIMADYAVDPERVYIAGLSAGAAAAANVAALYPDLFAAVGVHSGLACGAAGDLPSALTAMKTGLPGRHLGRDGRRTSTPMIVFHGDEDKVVHPANADHIGRHAGFADGAARPQIRTGRSAGGRSYTVAQHAGVDGGIAFENWTIHGGGHAWSGGGASGSYTDPTGPDASREMMRFFASHARRPGSADSQSGL